MDLHQRHQRNAGTGEPEQMASPFLPASEAAILPLSGLSQDYGEFVGLMAQLDKEVGLFTSNMAKLNDNLPIHAGLATLWEEQAKALEREVCNVATKPEPTRKFPIAPKGDYSDHINAESTDVGDNVSDRLVFI